MLKVGLTGGIGSGKSLVAEMFKLLGVPVLHADDTARYLMENNEELKSAIGQLFGKEVYENGRLNRPFLASVVFNDKAKLEQLNALVHPATIAYGREWAAKQNALYTIKEAAIFFESGSYKDMDKMIGVYAPAELRLYRAMQRDHATEAVIRARMDKQMNEEEKMNRCDYVIYNDGSASIIEQVLSLHVKISKLS
jgi:dephospho-CoA kinase